MRLMVLLLLLTPGLAGCASNGEGDTDYKAALEQADTGNVKEAMRILQAGAKKHPGHLKMRFTLARLQYETGEAFHLKERRLLRDAAKFQSQNKRGPAMANRRQGNEQHTKATPYYEAARKNLTFVIKNADGDSFTAWACFLMHRVALFFHDYEEAYEQLERAIQLGKPTGSKLAQMREFQAGIKEEIRNFPR